MKQQAVQRQRLGLERVEFDLRQTALPDFAPTIDARFGFLFNYSFERNEKLFRIAAACDLAVTWPCKRFHSIASQKLCPVFVEEIFGGEDVAPSDFASVGHDDANDPLVFEAACFTGETSLDFFDERIDRAADVFGLVVEPIVRLGWSFVC